MNCFLCPAHQAKPDADLLILLQCMTEEEKLALIKNLKRKGFAGNDVNEREKVNGASTSNVKSKVSFWKQIHGESVFDKDEEPIEETAANDTNDLFNELFAENYDNSLSELVIQQFNLLAE